MPARWADPALASVVLSTSEEVGDAIMSAPASPVQFDAPAETNLRAGNR